jgi:hypothetical protein
LVLFRDACLARDEDVGFALGEPARYANEAAEEMPCVVGGLGDDGESKDTNGWIPP